MKSHNQIQKLDLLRLEIASLVSDEFDTLSASVTRGARRVDNSAGDYITRNEFDAFKKSLGEYLTCLISK